MRRPVLWFCDLLQRWATPSDVISRGPHDWIDTLTFALASWANRQRPIAGVFANQRGSEET